MWITDLEFRSPCTEGSSLQLNAVNPVILWDNLSCASSTILHTIAYVGAYYTASEICKNAAIINFPRWRERKSERGRKFKKEKIKFQAFSTNKKVWFDFAMHISTDKSCFVLSFEFPDEIREIILVISFHPSLPCFVTNAVKINAVSRDVLLLWA